MTEAVRQAAEVLNYRDHPSRIILVSDGLESCNADPCALAAELARGGVDFTAPAEVETGALLEATWQAPARQGDEIYMISDNGEVFASVDATQGPPATFTAPAVIGQYAVVYRDRDGKDLFPRRFHRGAKGQPLGPRNRHGGQPSANQLARPGRGSGFCHHRGGRRAGE